MRKIKSTILPILLLLLTVNNFCWSQKTATFVVEQLPKTAKKVGIRGSQLPLSWEKSIPLEKISETSYSITLQFPAEIKNIQFKFVIDDTNQTQWEACENRDFTLSNEQPIISSNIWNIEQLVNIKALPLLKPEQLLMDYELLKLMILKIHPGTYRYNNDSSIQAALAELKMKFDSPNNHGDAVLAISKMLAQIQCDHTTIGLSNQNKIINSVIHRQKDKLPFTFKWVKDKMIVFHDATLHGGLQRGTQILKINNKDVTDIRKKLVTYVSADGATEKSRYAKLEVDGYDFRFNSFDVFYPLLFPPKGEQVELQIKLPDQIKSKTLKVPLLTLFQRSQQLINSYKKFPRTMDDLWNFTITKDKIGILTLNSFEKTGYKGLTLDYKKFIADVFSRIKSEKIDKLIIDIRNNIGGNDEISYELFTYFNTSKAKSTMREGRTRFTKFPDVIKPHVASWEKNPWYYYLNPDKTDSEYYIFKDKFEIPKKYKRKKDPFKGRVFLLTSPLNASLSFYFANNFKKYEIGEILGEETGGNLRDINGGEILFLRLPGSGIVVDFPVIGKFSLENLPNQGVQPDIKIEKNLEDIKNNLDSEMEIALKLITVQN